MAGITTKDGLFEFAKRKLGDPIVQVNVTDEQLEDCLRMTLEFWYINHYNGTEKVYIPHKVGGTTLTLADATDFEPNDVIRGITTLGVETGVVATIKEKTGNIVTIDIQTGGKLAKDDNIKCERTEATTTISDLTQGDMDNRWLSVDSGVYGVSKVFPLQTSYGNTTSNLFDVEYQLRLHEVGDLSSASLSYYKQVMTNINMLDGLLNGRVPFRFNRLLHRVYVDASWGSLIRYGDFILMEAYKALDPTTDPNVYNDHWVIEHFIASVKQQWGMNMKKFQGVQLPGGVTIDGNALFDEGSQEKQALEEDIVNNSGILEFFVG